MVETPTQSSRGNKPYDGPPGARRTSGLGDEEGRRVATCRQRTSRRDPTLLLSTLIDPKRVFLEDLNRLRTGGHTTTICCPLFPSFPIRMWTNLRTRWSLVEKAEEG